MTTHDTEYNWNDRMRDEGAWQRAQGKIREEWGEVTDDELEEVRGNWDQLVGLGKQKTGETADAVETKLKQWFS